MFEQSRNLIKEGKVQRVTENHWIVNKRNVRRMAKLGRSWLTCDCPNFTRFCNEPTICKHRVAVILYEGLRLWVNKK